MTNYQYLAFDIGAGSGRAILGTLDGCKVTLEEIHRFPNEMILRDGHYYWDINRLFEELMTGLRLCVKKHNIIPVSIGIDTWGVDFGLLDGNNQLIGNPFAYRDSLTGFQGDPAQGIVLQNRDPIYAVQHFVPVVGIKKEVPQLIASG
jgi:rhamnulokinase